MKATFLEFLGEITTDLIPTNLTNTSESNPSIVDFRQAFQRGFVVSAQIEQEILETPEQKRSLSEFVQKGRLRRASGNDLPGRKIIGLVLTPNE